jgi:glycerate-2-kinase
MLRDWPKDGARPVLWLGAGETTVTLRGRGRGGRNQEASLAAAIELDGTERACIAWLATDGIDGGTEAAGAIVDGETVRLGRVAGCDERAALAENDSYSFLAASKDLLISGPTGTNVADVVAAFVGGGCSSGVEASEND